MQADTLTASTGTIAFVVSGNHMSGLPKCAELQRLGGRLVGATHTSAAYRFYALPTTPPKPALVHAPDDSAAATITVEEWRLPLAALAQLALDVAPPQAIGRIHLADGRLVHGFVAQAGSLARAQDITACGSWRDYLAQPPAEHPTDIDHPQVVREVRAACEAYEQALLANDLERLDGFFWHNDRTVRFGPHECLYGFDHIRAFRHAQRMAVLPRERRHLVVTSFGDHFATCCVEDLRTGSGHADRIGRTTQVWARRPEGWRIVAAHVSVVPAGAPNPPDEDHR